MNLLDKLKSLRKKVGKQYSLSNLYYGELGICEFDESSKEYKFKKMGKRIFIIIEKVIPPENPYSLYTISDKYVDVFTGSSYKLGTERCYITPKEEVKIISIYPINHLVNHEELLKGTISSSRLLEIYDSINRANQEKISSNVLKFVKKQK